MVKKDKIGLQKVDERLSNTFILIMVTGNRPPACICQEGMDGKLKFNLECPYSTNRLIKQFLPSMQLGSDTVDRLDLLSCNEEAANPITHCLVCPCKRKRLFLNIEAQPNSR